MKKTINSILIGTIYTMATAITIQADSISDTYRSMMGGIAYYLNDITLHSGRYTIGTDNSYDIDLHNISIPGNYFFGDESQSMRAFITGAVGYSDYEQNSIDFKNGSMGDIDNEAYYIKAGGGLNWNITNQLALMGGATLLATFNDSSYNEKIVQNSKIDRLFNNEDTTMLYDFFICATYHPKYYGYKPYFIGSVSYIDIEYDGDGIGSDSGISSEIRAGFYTKELTRVWDMPIIAEVYVRASFVDNDLAKLTHFDSTFTGGTKFYWKVGEKIPFRLLKGLDITFTIQGTTSNTDMDGYNIGFGMSMLKF